MNKTKRIPFDVEKAKKGAKVVTRNGCSVRILDYNLKSIDTPIVAAVMEDTYEHVFKYKINGKHDCKDLYKFDLFIIEEVKLRRMTKRELAKWLREVPSEHREYKHSKIGYIDSIFVYYEQEENMPIDENILIRRNYDKWEEPIIEE